MKHLGNIIKKELKELITPATFLPIIIMAIIFGSLGGSIGEIEDEIDEKPIIGYIKLDRGNLSDNVESVLKTKAKTVYNSSSISDKNEALDYLKEKNGLALLLIPTNFTENILNGKPGEIQIFWVMKGAGLMDTVSSESVNLLVQNINQNISSTLIQQKNITNASSVLTPTYTNDTTFFKNREYKGMTPGEIGSVLSSQSTTIPIILMLIIIMSGGMVISSMALEKENKTLETLLTLPVNRTSIVAGKIIASAIIGLILALIYMIGLGYYTQSFQVGGNLDLSKYNLTLTTSDLAIIGLMVFVTLIAALSLCMLLGSLAKNYKTAQSLTFPVTILTLIPMFITMFSDFETLPPALQAIVFAIPFSHPMMAPRALIFDDYLFVLAGIIYVAVFAIIMISIVVWVFKTDKLITGSITKLNLFKKFK